MEENIPNHFIVGKIEAEYIEPDDPGAEGSIELLHDNMENPVEIDVQEVYDIQNLMSILIKHAYARAGSKQARKDMEDLADALEAWVEE